MCKAAVVVLSHEGELLVDVEQRPFCKVLGGGDGGLVGQHLTLQLGERNQRLWGGAQDV